MKLHLYVGCIKYENARNFYFNEKKIETYFKYSSLIQSKFTKSNTDFFAFIKFFHWNGIDLFVWQITFDSITFDFHCIDKNVVKILTNVVMSFLKQFKFLKFKMIVQCWLKILKVLVEKCTSYIIIVRQCDVWLRISQINDL